MCGLQRIKPQAYYPTNGPYICRSNKTTSSYLHIYHYDLKDADGFVQVEIHPPDRYKPGFVTHTEIFQYKYLPFGMASSPAIFTPYLLCNCNINDLFKYMDDIHIGSDSLAETTLKNDDFIRFCEKQHITQRKQINTGHGHAEG